MEANNFIDPHQYLPLVKSIVDRMDVKIPESWDKDDMIGYGILGLLEAMGRFQPDKGIQFATFASKRIRGAILDALRRDFPLSRNCWQKVQVITEAIERISANTGKEATINEIVKAVDMGKSEVEEAMQSFQLLASVSLEQTLGLNELKIKDTLKTAADKGPEEKILADEQTQVLSEALALIEKRQRMVLTLYYYEELTLKEIALALDVSVSRVSQLKTMGLAALRTKLKTIYG